MSSSYFPAEDPSLSKMMIFHIPKCVSTLTVLFKTAASHFSLLKIPHWLLIWIYIGYIIDYMLFFVLLSFIQEAINFFLFVCLSLDSFPSSMVLGYIRIKASPFPMRLQDIGQSRIVRRKHEDLLAKRSGFESQFHLIGLLRRVNLIICTKILIQCWCSTNVFPFTSFLISHMLYYLYFWFN